MKLKVLRFSSEADSTHGLLFQETDLGNRFLCYTLEDERRALKVKGETRVPAGIYKIEFVANAGINGNDRAWRGDIERTVNNSDYAAIATGYAFIQATESDSTYNSLYTCGIFDVTNTTNDKVRFKIDAMNSNTYCQGSSTANITFATFTRLGDT